LRQTGPWQYANLVLLAVILMLSVVSAAAKAEGLFRTHEIYSTNLAPFKKWDLVVARTEQQEADPSGFCRDGAQPCVATQWQSLVAELSALPIRERVARVNDAMNRLPYVTSLANWHDPDHWETPFEFLARGGQCEDYAIAKFMALAASGVPERDLRLVVVRDTVKALDHAILVVYVDGDPLVLDNQIKQVTRAAELDRYTPYYSINRTGWWSHLRDNPSTGRRFASFQ
jgi:predicted transglutaminase-like cysteine proteinase